MAKTYKKKILRLLPCESCGQEFPTKEGRRFCSRKCAGEAQSSQNWKLRSCKNCGDEFKPNNSTRKYCGKCDEGRVRTIFSRYGLSRIGVSEMLSRQEHNCALCPRKAQYVDHDHKTGEVRGMLCPACNTALGRVEDVPGWIEAAKRYLNKCDI